MLVIAIIGIMGGTVTVGWHSFSDFIAVRNAAGNIEVFIDGLENDHLRNEYAKSSVYFMEKYLLADSENSDVALSLKWETVTAASDGCAAGDLRLFSTKESLLFVSGPEGNFLSAPMPLYADDELCFDPLAYGKSMAVYWLRADSNFSNTVRVLPLNPAKNAADEVYLEPDSFRLDILKNYGKKERYKDNVPVKDEDPAAVTVKIREGDAEAVFDLPKN